MTTAFEAVSPVSSSTMASASAVPPASNTFASSFHNLTNHVILSSPNREDVNLALSPSSSFLSNFSSVCSNTPKSTIPSSFATSTFKFNSDTKENNSSTKSTSMSQNQSAEIVVKEEPTDEVDNKESQKSNCITQPVASTSGESKNLQTSCDLKVKEEEVDTVKAILVANQVADELDDSSNSNSTQSSDNIAHGSIRKKRRRGEDQILMEDLIGMDKSLANDIVNHLKTSSPTCTPVGTNSNEPDDASSQNESNESKKSKEDSPAFHLRPRRSHKTSSLSGYCSSGSSSPIYFLSPTKQNKQPLVKKSISIYTQQLLSDTSKQLNHILTDQHSHSGHNNGSNPAINNSTKSNSILIKNEAECSKPKETASVPSRTFVKSILRNVDVSVFAEMISPLNITYNSFYSFNYIAMKIVDIKPMRYVNLLHPTSQEKISCPLLEFITVDINDRFTLSHTKGIFDDPSITEASDKRLTIFLLGTYAIKGSEIGVNGDVVNIIHFRTSKLARNDQPLQPPKKRKLVTSPKKAVTSSDDEPENYAFHVIVDSLVDIATFKDVKSVKEELPDNSQPIVPLENSPSDCFEEIFNQSPPFGEASGPKWIPLVSFSLKWRAPEDPKELNKSLYVQQPCIPKFESASRTVKM